MYKGAVSFCYEAVVLHQSLSEETDRTMNEIYSGECVYDSELESSGSVRQRMLLVLIITVEYAVMTAGVSDARRRSVFLALFIVVFSIHVSLLLGSA